MFAARRSLDFVTVDVFTDQLFGGNPLAIIPDAVGLEADLMQKIAREFNYSETIFISPPSDPDHVADIRIFTPASELPFAGHPLVGGGWFLAQQRLKNNQKGDFIIKVAAGAVKIGVLGPVDNPTGAQLTAPRQFSLGGVLDQCEMAQCLGLAALDVLTVVHQPVVAGCGLDFAFVHLRNAESLARAKPDYFAFTQFLPREKAVGIYAYTTDAASDLDIESRMFAPLEGLIEDPATGSASVGFIGIYALYHRPDRQIGLVRQRIRQGFHMGRPSLVLAEAEKHQGNIVGTIVGGSVIPVMQGTMSIPSA